VVDREENGRFVGRTERDAPEIDNEVIVEASRHLAVGSFYEVDIVDSSEYDLYAVV
jgi:ribosomal protein S12 methylthiotransferase